MKSEGVTFAPVFRKKLATAKVGIVNIRITKERNSTFISLKETIESKYWDSRKGKLRETYKDYDRLTTIIEHKILELKTKYGITQDVEKTKAQTKSSFLKYLNEEIEYLESVKRIATSKRYRTAYFHLMKYLKSKGRCDLYFSDIDISFIKNYEAYFISNGIKGNSVKNYMSCIRRLYNQAVKEQLVVPMVDPFMFYENKREPVEKGRLTFIEIESILKLKPEPDTWLYHSRNYFLFQIFSQGIRVSDLMTLRFKNIVEGRFDFFQFKTKKFISILINNNMAMVLREYIKTDTSKIINQKYRIAIPINDKSKEQYSLTLAEIEQKYKEVKKGTLSKVLQGNEIPEIVKHWKKLIDDVRFKIWGQLIIVIQKYARANPNKFVFPILREEDFKDVEFNGNTKISKYQFNQMNSKTALYNKTLKKIEEVCELKTHISSHIARHTYTDLMLEEKIDVYDISKSLGHSRLTTTEHYIKDFSFARVDDSNQKVNLRFSVITP